MFLRMLLAALVAAGAALAQGTVEIENAWARVLRVKQSPHEKAAEHEHRRPGEIAWRDAYSHTTENIGDQTAVEIQIELK